MIRLMSAAVIVAVAAHVFLGWMWSPLGAVLAGFLVEKRGPVAGALSLLLAWGALVGWSWVQAPAETQEMWRVVGAITGNLPPSVTVVATLTTAGLLGMTGGWLGAGLRHIQSPASE